jgi:hypothetical protein
MLPRLFIYYGRKHRIAPLYDQPRHPLVIEPFAGAAAYSMFHLATIERVLLIEKDERVATLWERLLAMEPEDVMKIPVPRSGDDTSDFLLMTAAASNGVAQSRRMTVTDRMPKCIRAMLARIASILPEAKRKVTVVCGDYSDAPDVEATWFIDPPYQVTVPPGGTSRPQGMGYARGCRSVDLDYEALAGWCQSRRGQVLVCEQAGATWLPFRSVGVSFDSANRPLREVAWRNAGRETPLVNPSGAGASRLERLSRASTAGVVPGGPLPELS